MDKIRRTSSGGSRACGTWGPIAECMSFSSAGRCACAWQRVYPLPSPGLGSKTAGAHARGSASIRFPRLVWAPCGRLVAHLGPTCPYLRPTYPYLGPTCPHPGPLLLHLRPTCPHLDPTCPILSRKPSQNQAKIGSCWPSKGYLCYDCLKYKNRTPSCTKTHFLLVPLPPEPSQNLQKVDVKSLLS